MNFPCQVRPHSPTKGTRPGCTRLLRHPQLRGQILVHNRRRHPLHLQRVVVSASAVQWTHPGWGGWVVDQFHKLRHRAQMIKNRSVQSGLPKISIPECNVPAFHRHSIPSISTYEQHLSEPLFDRPVESADEAIRICAMTKIPLQSVTIQVQSLRDAQANP